MSCQLHKLLTCMVLQELAKHRILSAPLVITPDLEDVQDMPLRDPDANPTLVGWVDIPDILTALLQRKHFGKLCYLMGFLFACGS